MLTSTEDDSGLRPRIACATSTNQGVSISKDASAVTHASVRWRTQRDALVEANRLLVRLDPAKLD